MKVIHGTWIPNAAADFIQPAFFDLWVETPEIKKRRQKNQQIHTGHLAQDGLATFLAQELGIKEPAVTLNERISPKYFALPTANSQPIPSPELIKYKVGWNPFLNCHGCKEICASTKNAVSHGCNTWKDWD